MTFSVRPATRQDIPWMVDCQASMALESEGRTLDRDTLHRGMTTAMDQPQLARYWVAEDTENHRPVAMCMVTTEWSDWHNAFYWWLQSVYVVPEYRGQGVLGTLLERILEDAAQNGVPQMRLYVDTRNRRAIRAYEKLGFQHHHYLVMEKPVARLTAVAD